MEIVTPDDCGNSPRLAMVRDFTLAWASGDESAAGFSARFGRLDERRQHRHL